MTTTVNAPAVATKSNPTGIARVEQDFRRIVQEEPNSPHAQFVLGLTAYRSGRYEEAVDCIARAIAAEEANPDYHYYYAGACVGLGRFEPAIASYQRALALNGDHIAARQEMGHLLASRGRLEEAERCYREVLRRRSDYSPALAGLGDLLAQRGRFDEAADAFRKALEFNPADATTSRNYGNVCMRRGALEDAVAALRQSLRLRPDAETYNDLAIVLGRLGRRDEAIAAYREALRIRPEFPDAHNNLGNILRDLGKLDEAIGHFQEALRLRPNYPECHNNLAIALRRKGRHDEAFAGYHRALALRPTYAEAHNNLGFALADRGRLPEAVPYYQQAVRLRPDYFEAHLNLGNALSDLGRHGEAENVFRQAVRLQPRDARTHKSLGIVLARQDKFDAAVASFREALKLKPDFADVYNDLAITLSRQNKFEEALAAYRDALQIRPDFPEVYSNMGNALRNLGKFDESITAYKKAIELKPKYADAYNNLGIAYAEAGRFDEAVASYTECLRLHPNHVDAHMNRALTWLRRGDYAQGWAEYEWRWKKRALTNRPLIQPQWNGFPLMGRRILLITEQGFGDTIQFVRYCPVLKARGATVILECPERLIPLISRCEGIDHLIPHGKEIPDYDVYAPLLTVPGLVATAPESAPAEVPYIKPDPELVEKWRKELAGIEGFKVGINWQGNAQYAGDRHRSIPLKHFEALARIPGVQLISIQKNHGSDQLKEYGEKFKIIDLGPKLDESTGPFLDTAAVMVNLDLFITSDTAVAHLAGALGVPMWMALSTAADWRWMTEREDNPWYPTMRLFRQEEFMVWAPVFKRLAKELRKLSPAASRTRAIPIDAAPGELIDKITILQIKADRFQDAEKLRNVRIELAGLELAYDESLVESAELRDLTADLRAVNETLWQIEDDIRGCERRGDFGPTFIELARSVYQQNDLRAAIKRRINVVLGSEIIEEKAYSASGAAVR
jgi:tetratricopeptide (TPR) repeat protein